MRKDKRNKKKGKRSGIQNKFSLFQKPEQELKEAALYLLKGAPVIDYKNVKLLKKYISDTGKILPSRITSVSQNKQRKLSVAIKRASVLGLV